MCAHYSQLARCVCGATRIPLYIWHLQKCTCTDCTSANRSRVSCFVYYVSLNVHPVMHAAIQVLPSSTACSHLCSCFCCPAANADTAKLSTSTVMTTLNSEQTKFCERVALACRLHYMCSTQKHCCSRKEWACQAWTVSSSPDMCHSRRSSHACRIAVLASNCSSIIVCDLQEHFHAICQRGMLGSKAHGTAQAPDRPAVQSERSIKCRWLQWVGPHACRQSYALCAVAHLDFMRP